MSKEEKASGLDRRTFLKTAATSAVLVAPATVVAQPPEAAPRLPSNSEEKGGREPAMNGGGLSEARLGRMHKVMAGYVERGEVPGIVTLINRHGEVHVDAIGRKAVSGEPIRRDTIFRIASLT